MNSFWQQNLHTMLENTSNPTSQIIERHLRSWSLKASISKKNYHKTVETVQTVTQAKTPIVSL
jgi:hypothetical protein